MTAPATRIETAPVTPVGTQAVASSLAEDVRSGLLDWPKRLPPRLFYDVLGSALFDAITHRPEYYLTHLESELLRAHAGEIAEAVRQGAPERVTVVELGAGSAAKSQLLLEALVALQGPTSYRPIDVSPTALDSCAERLGREAPLVEVQPLAMRHEAALEAVGCLGESGLVLFIGSSIGNYSDARAVTLLGEVRRVLEPGGALLLGADRRKDVEVLLAAYNDTAGLTAAFNKNVLGRINRELGGEFELAQFDHSAIWNDRESAIEMHLVSKIAQRVRIAALELTVPFERGETIHTETSIKYDDARLDGILANAGFRRDRDWLDERAWFGVHLCRAV